MSILNDSQKLRDELDLRYVYEDTIHTNNLVSKTDVRGNIIYVNDEFCEITGYSRDELIGKNHRILKPKETTSDIYEPLWSTISSGKTYKGIVRNIAKCGREIYLSSTISPIVNADDEIIEYLAIRFNVTKEILLKKELEAKNKKLKKAYEIAKIGSWEYCLNSNITSFSSEVLKIFELDIEPRKVNLELLNKYISKDDIFRVTNFIQKITLVGEDQNCEFKININDKVKWIEATGKLDTLTNRIIGTIQDISERKEKEEELKIKERIIAQQSKMAIMGEMIANIAHQWRQPLSTITVGASGLLLQKQMNQLDDEFFENILTEIKNSASYLSETIDDFRDFFNPNKMKSEFFIEDTFDRTFKLMKSQFNTNNIEIVLDIKNFKILGLENELLQVLINILKNAKDELSKKDTKRLVLIEALSFENEATIKIKDNAGGIDKKNISKIFDAYFTTKTNDEGGTGIGLYMSKEIIEKNMNGKLEVKNDTFSYDNDIYKGALFTITLPLK